MNDVTIFSNEQFGQLRTITIEGEPWFVGKEICEIFGDKNSNRSLGRIDSADKRMTCIQTNGGMQNAVVINESGLYALLFAMQPQKAHNEGVSDEYPLEVQERIDALRSFKRWVTHEVLPSIRKHGAYVAGQTEMTREQLLAKAYEAVMEINKENEERISRLEEHNAILQETNERNAPKVLFANSVAQANTEILIGELAKLMKQNGLNIGQNRLYDKLREDGLIMWNSTIPTQKGMERGWFRVIERTITRPDGVTMITKTTKVTGKGQIALINKYLGKR